MSVTLAVGTAVVGSPAGELPPRGATSTGRLRPGDLDQRPPTGRPRPEDPVRKPLPEDQSSSSLRPIAAEPRQSRRRSCGGSLPAMPGTARRSPSRRSGGACSRRRSKPAHRGRWRPSSLGSRAVLERLSGGAADASIHPPEEVFHLRPPTIDSRRVPLAVRCARRARLGRRRIPRRRRAAARSRAWLAGRVAGGVRGGRAA